MEITIIKTLVMEEVGSSSELEFIQYTYIIQLPLNDTEKEYKELENKINYINELYNETNENLKEAIKINNNNLILKIEKQKEVLYKHDFNLNNQLIPIVKKLQKEESNLYKYEILKNSLSKEWEIIEENTEYKDFKCEYHFMTDQMQIPNITNIKSMDKLLNNFRLSVEIFKENEDLKVIEDNLITLQNVPSIEEQIQEIREKNIKESKKKLFILSKLKEELQNIKNTFSSLKRNVKNMFNKFKNKLLNKESQYYKNLIPNMKKEYNNDIKDSTKFILLNKLETKLEFNDNKDLTSKEIEIKTQLNKIEKSQDIEEISKIGEKIKTDIEKYIDKENQEITKDITKEIAKENKNENENKKSSNRGHRQ